jgi:hypothetical protein
MRLFLSLLEMVQNFVLVLLQILVLLPTQPPLMTTVRFEALVQKAKVLSLLPFDLLNPARPCEAPLVQR